jgi:hypothetical protein
MITATGAYTEMIQFEFQSSTYPNSQAFHRAIAESWLCAGGQNGREAMLEILAEASDEQLAKDCASGWGMLDHADFDGDDMLDAFREVRANFDAHFPGDAQEVLAALIGDRFAAILKDWFSDEEWAEMRRRNTADPAYAGTSCASHDFCDANMAMDEAFTELAGHEIDADNEADCALWNAAWSHARRHHIGHPQDVMAGTSDRLR